MSNLVRIPCFINGEEVEGKEYFNKYNPATGQRNALVVESDCDLVDRAVQSAKRAFQGGWSSTSLSSRVKLLRRLATLIDERIDEFMSQEIADTGKPIAHLRSGEIRRVIENIRVFAALAEQQESKKFNKPFVHGIDAVSLIEREPLGVVGIVAPWNLPLLLLSFKVAPALACGNTIVVKPSEYSPRTATLLARAISDVGFPDGVFNVIHGHGANAAGSMLVAHSDVDAITFTGETRTGEAIMRAASVGVRPVSLELGGKNAAIVMEDADLDAAVSGTARSMFDNAGQVCLTTERIFVHRRIFDEFVDRLARRSKTLVPGDPFDPATTFGPAISDRQRDKVLRLYESARLAGASTVVGGGSLTVPAPYEKGYWVSPTIWTGLPDSAEVCRSEVFGPCGHVAPFDEDEEVIHRTNASSYGLAATVWSLDPRRASYIARRLRVGTVWINCWRVRDERVAFGGMKRSGVGREGGDWSFDFYSELKTICSIDR